MARLKAKILGISRAPKRPRVDAEASGSKSPPWIITDPFEHLQEVLVVLCYVFFANLFILA